MKINRTMVIIAITSGLILGSVCEPAMSVSFLNKLKKKFSKPIKSSKSLYSALKKDVKNLQKDKDKLTKDVKKLKAIPGQLKSTISKIKKTLIDVKKNLVSTGKHIEKTGKDAAVLKKIYSSLK